MLDDSIAQCWMTSFFPLLLQNKKVFLVKSGYRALRRTLRERGWVEQNYKVVEEKPATTPPKKPPLGGGARDKGKTAAENSDDDGDGEDDDVDEPLDESSDEEWSDEEEYYLCVSAGGIGSGVTRRSTACV